MTHNLQPIAPRYAFGLHDRIGINNIFYSSESSDENCHVLRRVDQPDLCESFSHDQIADLRQAKSLSVEPDYFLAPQAALRKKSKELLVSDLPVAAQKKVMYRQFFCDEFLKEEAVGTTTRSDAKMLQAILRIDYKWHQTTRTTKTSRKKSGKEITKIHPPSPTALRRWLRAYEAYNRRPIVLADSFVKSGNYKSRFSEEVEKLLQSAAISFGDTRNPKISSVHKDLEDWINDINIQPREKEHTPLKVPSRKALKRRIDRLHPMRLYASREGMEKAQKKFHPVRGGLKTDRPLQRVEMDEWQIHLQGVLSDEVKNALPDSIKP